MSEPTVRSIVAEWLTAHGYDGLVCDDWECGCWLGDLFRCNGQCERCEPAYRVPCTCEDHDGSHMTSQKPEAVDEAPGAE